MTARPTCWLVPLFPQYIGAIADHPIFDRPNVAATIRVDARYTTDASGIVNFGTETSASAFADSVKKAYATISAALSAEGKTVPTWGVSADILGNGRPVGSSAEGDFPLCQSIFRNPLDKPVPSTTVIDPYPRCWHGIRLNKAIMETFANRLAVHVAALDLPPLARLELSHEANWGDLIDGFHRDDVTGHIDTSLTGWMTEYQRMFEYVCREPIGGLITGKVTAETFWNAMLDANGDPLPALNTNALEVGTFQIGRSPYNNEVTNALIAFAFAGYCRAAYLAFRQPLKAALPHTRLGEYSMWPTSQTGQVRLRPDGPQSGLTGHRQGYFQAYDYMGPDMYKGIHELRGDDPGGATFGLGTGWGTDQNWETQLGISTSDPRFTAKICMALNRANLLAIKTASPNKIASPYLAAAPYGSNLFTVAEAVEMLTNMVNDGSLDAMTWFVPYLGNDSDYRDQFTYIDDVLSGLESEVAFA
jgi:hypothetical protein